MKCLDSGNLVANVLELSGHRRSVATRLPRRGAFDEHRAPSDRHRRELGSNDGGAPK